MTARSRQRSRRAGRAQVGQARFIPPVNAIRPSITMSFRWFLRFARPLNGTCSTGMKKATCAASLDQRRQDNVAEAATIPGRRSSSRTATPSEARCLNAFQDRPAPLIPAQDVSRDVDRLPRLLDQPEDPPIRIDPIRHELEAIPIPGRRDAVGGQQTLGTHSAWHLPSSGIGCKSGPSFAPADSSSARRTSRTAVHRYKAPTRSPATRRSYCWANAAVSGRWRRKPGPTGIRDGSVTRTRARCRPLQPARHRASGSLPSRHRENARNPDWSSILSGRGDCPKQFTRFCSDIRLIDERTSELSHRSSSLPEGIRGDQERGASRPTSW